MTDRNGMSNADNKRLIKELLDSQLDKSNLPRDIIAEGLPEEERHKGLLVGHLSISTELLPKPKGLAYDFTEELAGHSCDVFTLDARGNTFATYSRKELQELAREYAEGQDKQVEQQILDWVAHLPWNANENITLVFYW